MEDKNKELVDQLRPHVYDGIEEFDNPLPRWWVGMFYFCIAFSVIYMIYYHMAGGPSPLDEMHAQLEKEKAARVAAAPAGGQAADGDPVQALLAMMNDQAAIKAGGETYKTNCSPCHGDAGQGVVGPNLADKYWLNGGKPEEIYKTIADGVVEKGMIAWQPILGVDKVRQVTAYVNSLKGTNPPNPKAPEGQPVE